MKACPLLNQRGIYLVLMAAALPVLLAVGFFAYDLGRVFLLRAALQGIDDLAVLAGAKQWLKEPSKPKLDNVATLTVRANDPAATLAKQIKIVSIDIGRYDPAQRSNPSTKGFTKDAAPVNAVRVILSKDTGSFLFKYFFGTPAKHDLQVEAIGVICPDGQISLEGRCKCGNGVVEPPEVCDGGAGCTPACLCDTTKDFEFNPVTKKCEPKNLCVANNKLDPGEECLKQTVGCINDTCLCDRTKNFEPKPGGGCQCKLGHKLDPATGECKPIKICVNKGDLLVILDVSGSTVSASAFHPRIGKNTLQAEILMTHNFVGEIQKRGLADQMKMGIIVFNSRARYLDMDPKLSGVQIAALVSSDTDGNKIPDVVQPLDGLAGGGNTSYSEAIGKAVKPHGGSKNFFEEIDSLHGKNIIFLSDGLHNTPAACEHPHETSVKDLHGNKKVRMLAYGLELDKVRLEKSCQRPFEDMKIIGKDETLNFTDTSDIVAIQLEIKEQCN